MKILKQQVENKNITREVIGKLGETLYHNDGIKSVSIEVLFNDGSSVGFKRNEDEDHFDDAMGKK